MSIAEKEQIMSANNVVISENMPKVYEAGKKAEYNEFWDSYIIPTSISQNIRNVFSGQGWTKKTFTPNRDFYVQSNMFYYHNWQHTPYDLATHLEELGVAMKIGYGATDSSFRMAWFTRLPVLDFSKCSGSYNQTFYSATGSPLITIDKIILPPEGKVTSFNATFQNCSNLKNITFEGVIDRSISFASSPLSMASMSRSRRPSAASRKSSTASMTTFPNPPSSS